MVNPIKGMETYVYELLMSKSRPIFYKPVWLVGQWNDTGYCGAPPFRVGDIVYSMYSPETALRVTEVKKYTSQGREDRYTVQAASTKDGKLSRGDSNNFRLWTDKPNGTL
jgi:hypothetical protein